MFAKGGSRIPNYRSLLLISLGNVPHVALTLKPRILCLPNSVAGRNLWVKNIVRDLVDQILLITYYGEGTHGGKSRSEDGKGDARAHDVM